MEGAQKGDREATARIPKRKIRQYGIPESTLRSVPQAMEGPSWGEDWEASIGFSYKDLNSDIGKSRFSKQEWPEWDSKGLGLKGEVKNRDWVRGTLSRSEGREELKLEQVLGEH